MYLAMSIKRVTTTFLVKGSAAVQESIVGRTTAAVDRQALRIAIFHRCATMPTFPNRYAGCSGSMEEGELPWETARRELGEETNWEPTSSQQFDEPTSAGLLVDVDFVSPRSGRSSIIRVYPFVVVVPESFELQLKGTEHDSFRWMGLEELERLDEASKTVPFLALAFHHATAGRFDTKVTTEERQWAFDKENGASTMSRNALQLIMETDSADPTRLAMLRPSMVTIINCMTAVQRILSIQQQSTRKAAAQEVLAALDHETERSVQCAVEAIVKLYHQRDDNSPKPLVLATFSRSSTLLSILRNVLQEHAEILQLPILCGKSTPGGEGELMAKDLDSIAVSDKNGDVTIATCVDDDKLKERLRSNEVDVLLVGADCVLSDHSLVVNKVGTAELASVASNCQVLCCTDRFKVWDDIFPPPLEKDLFEMVPVDGHIDQLLLPPAISDET